MLKSGDVVHAIVNRREEYGVYLESNGQLILVTVPYLSWTARVRSGSDFASIGAEFEVKLGPFVESEKVWRGSIRDAHPEDDPWTKELWLQENAVHIGVVYEVVHAKTPNARPFGYGIELCAGVEAMLPDDGKHPIPKIGDRIPVELFDVLPQMRKLRVRYAEP